MSLDLQHQRDKSRIGCAAEGGLSREGLSVARHLVMIALAATTAGLVADAALPASSAGRPTTWTWCTADIADLSG